MELGGREEEGVPHVKDQGGVSRCGSSAELAFPACERKDRRKPNQALSASDRDTDLMTS